MTRELKGFLPDGIMKPSLMESHDERIERSVTDPDLGPMSAEESHEERIESPVSREKYLTRAEESRDLPSHSSLRILSR
jgi:hypothetical protein